MKRIWKVIGNRWLISLVGLCAIAVLIWILGPLFAFAGHEPLATEFGRSLAIVAVIAVWALIQVHRYLRIKRANAQMLDAVAAESEQSAAVPGLRESEEEVAALRQRFDKALTVLKKARLGNKRQQRQYLYQLPWYLIIGPPGCGKTTALINSGLQFPLAEQLGMNAIQGVGGTRNCDWWFTNEAVLIDTAGRYTTQDSYQEVDSAAWQGFLLLLKKHRRRRPINGVLVAVSIADLVEQSQLERSAHARAIRQRIQELHEHFRIRFPIYVVLTKTDLLAGFPDFFSELGREERRQVFGMTFSLEDGEDGDPAITHFSPEFDQLEESLNARLVSRLEQERDTRRRRAIYAFPQQFSSIREIVDHFLKEAFAPNLYQERPMIRGVYFTSGTQEGSPIDRLLGTMASEFGLDRTRAPTYSGKGRSYFINRLLVDVAFAESGLAGLNLRLERQRNWVQRGAYASALALTVLAAAAWFVSYGRNVNYIQEVATQTADASGLIEEVSVADTESYFAIPSLEAIRGIPGGYDDRNQSPPWLSGLGLYQGDKLGSEAQAAYRRLLRNMFLPRLVLRLEEILRQDGASPDYLYEALKVYLMLAEPEHFDADTVKAWLTLDWEIRLKGKRNVELREALLSHLDVLLAALPHPLPVDIDTELRDRVRAKLLRLPLAERTYDRIKRTNIDGPQPPFRVSDVTGADGKRIFARKSGKALDEGIPGLYTRDGYTKIFLPQNFSLAKHLSGEHWIFGPDFALDEKAADIFELSCQVRKLYFEDYVRLWTELLQDLRIVQFNNLQHAVEVLNIASGPTSPVRRLLAAVERETTLDSLPDPTSAVPVTSGRLSRMTDRLRQLIEVERQIQKHVPSCDADSLVEREFDALRQQVQPLGDSPPRIEATLSTLNELYVHMSSILRSGSPGKIPLDIARDEARGATSIVDRLKLEAGRQPAPLNELLGSMANRVSSLNIGNVRSHLNGEWRGTILPFCERSVSGRFPLDRNSLREITLEDFGRFFGPGGLLDDFFKTHLKEFVDTSGRTWRWNPSGRRTLGISSSILVQMQRAAAIREAFFRGSEAMPSVRFSLKPIYMDTSISQFHLILDDQAVSYDHGPTRWSNLQWPGPEGSNQVQIMLSPVSAVSRSTLTSDGPWAWFRLIEDSELKPTSTPERLEVTFDVGARKARFLLRASSALNPFQLKELREFQCPSRL